jgi:hypothetical protein
MPENGVYYTNTKGREAGRKEGRKGGRDRKKQD